MIDKELIKGLIDSYLDQNNLFLVAIESDNENNIEVTIESDNSTVELNDCVNLSGIIEKGMDREKEDFSLTVTSAGLDRPLKVLRQFRKYCGKEVDIVMKSGERFCAVIQSAEESGIGISYEKLVRAEGRKKKEKTEVKQFISFQDLKSVKPKIKI